MNSDKNVGNFENNLIMLVCAKNSLTCLDTKDVQLRDLRTTITKIAVAKYRHKEVKMLRTSWAVIPVPAIRSIAFTSFKKYNVYKKLVMQLQHICSSI